MTLPNEIAKQIVSYLSPCDLGRVAQLNKTWRNAVYSNSCWDINKLWEVKTESRPEFYSGFEIPANARHIGSPTSVCFHDWLSLARKSMFHTSIPYCILESDKFDTYIHYYRKLWNRLGCPCIHTNHHKWYDVYRGREFLYKLSVPDQQRIFYRHCRFITDRNTVGTNPYRYWLMHHIENSILYNYSITPLHEHATSENIHPADYIRIARLNKDHKRLTYLHQKREATFQNFQISIQSLRKYSKKEFETKHFIWEELFCLFEKPASYIEKA